MMQPWPLAGVGGAVIGFALVALHQPLRAELRQALAWLFRHPWLWVALGCFLGVERFLFPTQDRSTAMDWRTWLPHTGGDVMAVFWQIVPARAAFLLGLPLALLFAKPLWWDGASPRGRIVAVALIAPSAWWWLARVLERAGATTRVVPDLPWLQQTLWCWGEVAFASMAAAFVHMTVWLAAYRARVGGGPSGRRESVALARKCWRAFLPVPLALAAAKALHDWRLPSHLENLWHGLGLALGVGLAGTPICLLLLQGIRWREAIPAGWRFLRRAAGPFAWLVFSIIAASILWRIAEETCRNFTVGRWVTPATVGLGFLHAAWLLWFSVAFCFFFCRDVSERLASGRKQSTAPAKPKPKKRRRR